MARKPQKFTLDPIKFMDWLLNEEHDRDHFLAEIVESLTTEYKLTKRLQGFLQDVEGHIPPDLVTNPQYFTIEQLACIEACDCVFPPLN